MLLRLEQLEKRIGDRLLFGGANAVVRARDRIGIVGPNGAGKTTLIKLIARLYEVPTGSIHLDGVDVAGLTPAAVRARVGVVFQDFVQFHLTAGENIGLGWLPDLDDSDEIAEAA
ncbi:MAG: ATP-binding cassette domain-containing protein, partial [Alphaproteobacteria bacterium]|nr:ATP-binding cassette domain-containing protein [Alphaproteobacteria bacterium]